MIVLRTHSEPRLGELLLGTTPVPVDLPPEVAKLPPGFYDADTLEPVDDPAPEEEPEPKFAKDEVEYGPGRAGSRCGVCAHFAKPDGCWLVEGSIEPGAWCELFVHELLT